MFADDVRKAWIYNNTYLCMLWRISRKDIKTFIRDHGVAVDDIIRCVQSRIGRYERSPVKLGDV